MASKHTSADSPQAGTYGQQIADGERSDLRRFRQGDGEIMIPPGEVVRLDYVCAACGRAYEIALQAGSQPTLIDCNEERLCDGCQKKSLVTMLLERGTTVPEEKLLTMTVEELLALASAEVR
jgi:DNA-directed RNA polymerase subunit RPC12/RpoP